MYISKREVKVDKEKILSSVELRANLSEIIELVRNRGQTYIIKKRGKPVAVIMGFRKYKGMVNGKRLLKSHGSNQILKLSNTATSIAKIDNAIKNLRKSRIVTLSRAFK